MKIEAHSVDLLVDTGVIHSVVTKPVGPLSQGHATIVRAMGDQTHYSSLVSRNAIWKSMM
jgi:hypothetical protein